MAGTPPPAGLLTDPVGNITALMNDPDEVVAATDELATAGVSEDQISVLCGPEGADRLDVSGRRHGLHGRIYRLVEHVSDLNKPLERAADHMRAGGFAVFVPAEEETKYHLAGIIRRHGGSDVIYHGLLSWEEILPGQSEDASGDSAV